MARGARYAGAVLLLVLLAGAVAWRVVRNPKLGAVERGRRVAESSGCFGCHGPGGTTGLPDGGNGIAVPAFTHDDLTQYARNEAEIREWILDGVPQRVREQEAADEAMAPDVLEMPAFRGRLSTGEVDDLVQYVKAMGDFEVPPEGAAREGLETARRLGCFACHGPQGRGAIANPGSFKGYVPAWDGPDFEEIARDDAEVRGWILDGMPQRLRDNVLARHFLDRQLLKMPAYRGRITDAELEQVLSYVRWLRTPRG
jgi:mono/diheme cytochrome c family protein